MSGSPVPRRVIKREAWQVVHPFTEAVEFSTTNEALAKGVAHEFDKHDPVTVDWLIERLRVTPPYQRRWLVSPTALTTLRKLADARGAYLWHPTMVGGDTLLGIPLEADEETVGVKLEGQDYSEVWMP